MTAVDQEPMGPFGFDGELWEWTGQAAWHFVTVPPDLSDLIAELRPRLGPGFGSVKVEAAIDEVRWRTSVFPDATLGAYLLPVKAAVRRRLGLEDGTAVHVELTVI